MILDDVLEDRLVAAFGGRPLTLELKDEQFCVTVWSEDEQHFVCLRLSRDDIKNNNHQDFKDRFVDSICANLDGVQFPKRWKRFMAANRRIAYSAHAVTCDIRNTPFPEPIRPCTCGFDSSARAESTGQTPVATQETLK